MNELKSDVIAALSTNGPVQEDRHILTPLITLSTRFKSSVLLSEDECVRKEFLRLIPSIDLESEIKHVEWLKVQSSLLRKETFILLEYDTATPLFGLIMDILCFDAIFLGVDPQGF